MRAATPVVRVLTTGDFETSMPHHRFKSQTVTLAALSSIAQNRNRQYERPSTFSCTFDGAEGDTPLHAEL